MASKAIIEERFRDLKLILVIWIFPYQNSSIKEYAWKIGESLSYVVSQVRIPYGSHAQGLCVSCAVHVCYSLASKEVSYTQDLSPDNSNHDLGTPKCGFWKGGGYNSLSLSLFLEVEDNSHQKSLGNLNP